MNRYRIVPLLCALAFAALADEAPKPLLDPAGDLAKQLEPSSKQCTVAASPDAAAPGVVVKVATGPDGYPGVNIKPAGGKWDLSKFGHVELVVQNTSAKQIGIALRVDNAGDWRDNPWNAEQTWIKPGAKATLKTIFGFQYGYKPGYKLKPAEITNVLIFTFKADAEQSFRLESLVAAGPAGETPPVDPKSLRVKPVDGFLFGGAAKFDAKTMLEAKGGAVATLDGAALKVELPAAKGEQSVLLKPAVGRWDLREACQVSVKLRNSGTVALTPKVQVASDSGSTAAVETALAAGATAVVTVPFQAPVPWTVPAGYGVKPGWEAVAGTGTKFGSDAASGVRVLARTDAAASLVVEAVTASAPPAELPAWLGARPPVDGEWVKTFEDNFDGPTMDLTRWNITGPNYWDKVSHWSKDNTILGDGVVKLHYEKKTGKHNDEPNGKFSNYCSGYLDTYGKWVQRYGYYEARQKLPTAPGLWPAFWMMPDRGVAFKDQWKRADTGNGAMEFDIMEHLTRWGRYRYNVALHWDGYGKDHKSVGNTWNYVPADKDGFITTGMLWLPGQLVFYGNGKELFRWDDARISNVPSNLIIYLVAGGWDNNSVDDKQLPADYVIDYVRVWQRKDLASAVDGLQPQPAAKP